MREAAIGAFHRLAVAKEGNGRTIMEEKKPQSNSQTLMNNSTGFHHQGVGARAAITLPSRPT